MIKSFKSKEAEKIYKGEYVSNFSASLQDIARRKLWMLDAATIINDLRIPPANNLKKLKGKKKREYSIRINKQWRICFKWEQEDAYDVQIIDYH